MSHRIRPMNCGVYAVVNMVNGKQYVGSSQDISSRLSSHKAELRKGKHHGVKLQNAWRKYGEHAFVFKRVLVCDKADLLFYEQLIIDAWDVCQRGYNSRQITDRNTGHKYSAEARANMSRVQSTTPRTDTWREAVVASNKARVFTPEMREKMAAAKRGVPRAAETRAKISAYQTTRTPASDETRARISAGLRAAHARRKQS